MYNSSSQHGGRGARHPGMVGGGRQNQTWWACSQESRQRLSLKTDSFRSQMRLRDGAGRSHNSLSQLEASVDEIHMQSLTSRMESIML